MKGPGWRESAVEHQPMNQGVEVSLPIMAPARIVGAIHSRERAGGSQSINLFHP